MRNCGSWVKSKTDSFSRLQQKIIEYRRNGVKLGWLIHPGKRKVLVYGGPEREVLELDNPDSVTGHGPVAGFVLHLNPVWEGLDALN